MRNKSFSEVRGLSIDWKKVMLTLDWSAEVTPVSLVKAVNSVMKLTKPKDKFFQGNRYFGDLVKQFESFIPSEVTIRQSGKDRFYKLTGKSPEDLHYWLDTGEFPQKKQEKVYTPVPVTFEMPAEEESKPGKGKVVRKFPDNESIIKTLLVLGSMKKYGKKVDTHSIQLKRKELGYIRQRSCGGRQYTLWQEVEAVSSSLLDLRIDTSSKKFCQFKGSDKELEDGILTALSLLETPCPPMIQNLLQTEKEEEKKEEVVEEKKEEKVNNNNYVEVKVEEKPKPKSLPQSPEEETETQQPKQQFLNFEEFKEQYKEEFENRGIAWLKGLLIEASSITKSSSPGQLLDYISSNRFVEIPFSKANRLIKEIESRYRSLRSPEAMRAYDLTKMTNFLLIRSHQNLEELEETYPNLKFKLLSDSSTVNVTDNIFEVTINKTLPAEEQISLIILRMRKGEKVLYYQDLFIKDRIQRVISGWGMEDFIKTW